MLGPETDEHDAAVADPILDHRRPPFEDLSALEIAAAANVADEGRETGYDVAVEARVGNTGFEGRRDGEVDRLLLAETPTERVRGVDRDPQG